MHCPNCGTEATVEQKFCRSCGLGLEKVPQLIAEQLGSVGGEDVEKLQQRQQKIERSLLTAGISFVALAVLSMLAGVLYLIVTGSMPLVPGIVMLMLFIAGIVAGSLGYYSERLKKTLSAGGSVKLKELAGTSTAELPPQSIPEPLMSITERTTNLLEPQGKK